MSYTATDAAPTIITMPIANTLTNGDIPFLAEPPGKRRVARESFPVFLLLVSRINL